MTRFFITAAAALAISGTAFAQDAMQDQKVEEGVEMMQDGAEMAQEGAEMVEKATGDDMVGDKMLDGDMSTTVVEPAPVLMSSEPMNTTGMDTTGMDATGAEVERVKVACPEGSTAQPDGTCMMEGDALPE